jgi:hypothetical protein
MRGTWKKSKERKKKRKEENCRKIKRKNSGKFWKQSPSFFDTTRTTYKTKRPKILPCRGNVFPEPLPSNSKGDTHRLMGGIYEVRR